MKTRLVGKPVPEKADNSSPHKLLPSFLLSRRWFANCSFASYGGVPEPFQVQEVNIWNFPLLGLDFGRGNIVLRCQCGHLDNYETREDWKNKSRRKKEGESGPDKHGWNKMINIIFFWQWPYHFCGFVLNVTWYSISRYIWAQVLHSRQFYSSVTQTLLAAPLLWNIQLLSTIKQLQKVHEGHPPGAAIFWRRNFHELVLAGWNLMLPFHDLSTMAMSTSFSFASTHQHVVSEARDHNRKSFAEIFEPPKLTRQGSSYKFCLGPFENEETY